jgi:hypothetical protein
METSHGECYTCLTQHDTFQEFIQNETMSPKASSAFRIYEYILMPIRKEKYRSREILGLMLNALLKKFIDYRMNRAETK